MSEQIEVLGQFDVRRNVVSTDPETSAPEIITIDETRIKNTFGGDQLDATVCSVRDKKRYFTGYNNEAKKFYISRKDCPVHNFCKDLAGPNKRSEGLQMFDEETLTCNKCNNCWCKACSKSKFDLNLKLNSEVLNWIRT